MCHYLLYLSLLLITFCIFILIKLLFTFILCQISVIFIFPIKNMPLIFVLLSFLVHQYLQNSASCWILFFYCEPLIHFGTSILTKKKHHFAVSGTTFVLIMCLNCTQTKLPHLSQKICRYCDTKIFSKRSHNYTIIWSINRSHVI